jgi:hypothetical protein
MKYDWDTSCKFIIDVTVVVSRSSKFFGHVTVVSYPIFTELFVAYVTVDGLFERLPVAATHFHRFAVLEFLFNVFLFHDHMLYKLTINVSCGQS